MQENDFSEHKFIHLPQAMKIPAAKAAVDKEWDKLEKIPAGQLTKVSNKKDVIDEARNKGRKVHFASLMDLCHLKNSELEPQFQKYKGRVVLRGDIVKNDSASFAVLTDQRSSASQMSLPNRNGLNHGPVWKNQSFLLSESCTVILYQDYSGKGNSRKFY